MYYEGNDEKKIIVSSTLLVKKKHNDKYNNIKECKIRKRPLGRPRIRWKDSVKRDIKVVDPKSQLKG